MAKHSKGKHAAKVPAAAGTDVAEAPEPSSAEGGAAGAADAPSADASDGSPSCAEDPGASACAEDPAVAASAPGRAVAVPKERKGVKIALVAVGCILGVLGIAYLAGVAAFSFVYPPNTSIQGMDFSFQTSGQMAQALDEKVGDFGFSVSGQGLDFDVDPHDAALTLDAERVAAEVLARTNPWAWPAELFRDHDMSQLFAESMDAGALGELVDAQVQEANATAVAPVDATIAFDEAAGAFEVVKEKQGTMLDGRAVMEAVTRGVLDLQPKIVLTDAVRVQPAVLYGDERLDALAAEANRLVGDGVALMLDGAQAAVLEPATIASWISVTPELTIGMDDAAVTAWAEETAKRFDTVGTTRTYTRADGKNVTVSGGVYGWRIDGDALVSQVVSAVQAGGVDMIEIPVTQTGKGFDAEGGRDWGPRYADVDLSEQKARFYDDAGALVWESDIVSGEADTGYATPTGVWKVNNKQSPTVLIGKPDPETGKPSYESPVEYWMPFEGNYIGFHDANWQAAFGGSRYRSGFGSKGCINLPTGKAADLYRIINVGDVVVVHY